MHIFTIYTCIFRTKGLRKGLPSRKWNLLILNGKRSLLDDFDEEDVSAPADKELSLQFLDISDEQNYIVLKDLDSKTVMSRIEKILKLNADKTKEAIGFSFDVPKCGTMMLTFHKGHQQLAIEHLHSLVREFPDDETKHMAVATVVVLSKVFYALKDIV
jgi:hypothetical protein